MNFLSVNIVENLYSQFSSLAIFYLPMNMVSYFMIFRWGLGSYIIKRIKRTRKEEKKRTDEIIDLIFGGFSVKLFKRLTAWILCKSYTKEQKGKFYIPFVVINYIYITLFLAGAVMQCYECIIVIWIGSVFWLKERLFG